MAILVRHHVLIMEILPKSVQIISYGVHLWKNAGEGVDLASVTTDVDKLGVQSGGVEQVCEEIFDFVRVSLGPAVPM